jgi:hypothetical protein
VSETAKLVTEESRTIFTVTKVGVYDHGVYLVTDDRALAEKFCETTPPDKDEYHHWRIDEHQLNVPDAVDD